MNLIKKLKSLGITEYKLAKAEHPNIKNTCIKGKENKKINTSRKYWGNKLKGISRWSTADIERLKGLLNSMGYEDTITYEDYIPCLWKIRK